MSGRIRTIKPELLEDAITAGLSPHRLSALHRLHLARRRLRQPALRDAVAARSGVLGCEVTLDEFADAIEELTVACARVDGAARGAYVVKGQRYAAIRGWSKHQRVQKPGKPRVPGRAPPESGSTLSGDPPESLPPDLRSPIVEDDHQSESAAARALTHWGSLRSGARHRPSPSSRRAWTRPFRTRGGPARMAIVHRTSVDFDVPGTWRKYVAACMDGRRRLTEPGWVLWAENECRFTASRQARRDDTAWGKVRPAVAEPGDMPYCAAAKPPCTPDYDRETAVTTAAALAAGNFGPTRQKAGGT
jgi:hypothetical protein